MMILNKLFSVMKFDNNLNDKFNLVQNKINKIKNKENITKEQKAKNKKQIQDLYTSLLDELLKSKLYVRQKESYANFINKLFNSKNVLLASWFKDYKEILENYPILFSGNKYFISETNKVISDMNIFWGTQFYLNDNIEVLNKIIKEHSEYAIAEMGFLHRIAFPAANKKFSQGCSFVFDDIAPYYDARFPNRLEILLNDEKLIITEEQKLRAKKCIKKIVDTHLTKYNHQPIYNPKIGRDGVKKVLVVDQVYGDMSIAKGLANNKTFGRMLKCAIKENPDADIIVKTHPDTLQGAGGYYTGLKEHNNVYLMTEPINPISLIKYCDKVYVCTSQFGFEALMCGKEVHTFGVPFYSGWGITIDNQKCKRRIKSRTLEEVFYITYIMYSYYVNPETSCSCEIEEVMDYLLKLRDEYFSSEENMNG